MSLETASYVANLVVTNPDGGDARSTADDHIRLIKAALRRTFPLLDSALSLSAAQVHYVGDLSASVQLQLNQLRDGSATANNAVNARYANSASTAANLGGIAAANYARIDATNVPTVLEPWRLLNTGFYGFYDGARFGYLQANNNSAGILIVAETAIPVRIYTNNQLRFTIEADGTLTIPGLITGTITSAQNATTAATATNATFATNATNAVTAQTAISASSAALLTGLSPDAAATPGTIAQRNGAGYLFAEYFNSNARAAEAISIGHVFAQTAADGYMRPVDMDRLGSYLSARNISTKSGITKTLSTSSPSGGSNGDIWYKY